MPINWGGMLNLLLLPAVLWAISLCHVYPSSFFLVDIEFGIQDWEEETLKARSVRKGISLLKLGNGSWLLWEQHPNLGASALFPKAFPKCWQAQGKGARLCGWKECSPFSKRQGMFADPVMLSLSWHHRPRAEQGTKTSPMAPARVLLALNFWL